MGAGGEADGLVAGGELNVEPGDDGVDKVDDFSSLRWEMLALNPPSSATERNRLTVTYLLPLPLLLFLPNSDTRPMDRRASQEEAIPHSQTTPSNTNRSFEPRPKPRPKPNNKHTSSSIHA